MICHNHILYKYMGNQDRNTLTIDPFIYGMFDHDKSKQPSPIANIDVILLPKMLVIYLKYYFTLWLVFVIMYLYNKKNSL